MQCVTCFNDTKYIYMIYIVSCKCILLIEDDWYLQYVIQTETMYYKSFEWSMSSTPNNNPKKNLKTSKKPFGIENAKSHATFKSRKHHYEIDQHLQGLQWICGTGTHLVTLPFPAGFPWLCIPQCNFLSKKKATLETGSCRIYMELSPLLTPVRCCQWHTPFMLICSIVILGAGFATVTVTWIILCSSCTESCSIVVFRKLAASIVAWCGLRKRHQ